MSARSLNDLGPLQQIPVKSISRTDVNLGDEEEMGEVVDSSSIIDTKGKEGRVANFVRRIRRKHSGLSGAQN